VRNQQENIAEVWLNLSMQVNAVSSFTIPTCSDFEKQLVTSGRGDVVIIEEARKGQFRTDRKSCCIWMESIQKSVEVPLPGFMTAPSDPLLQQEFATLLKHPCGANIDMIVRSTSGSRTTVRFLVLPLLDDDYVPRYLTLQACEYTRPAARAQFIDEQKPDKRMVKSSFLATPSNPEYNVHEYLDLGWGIPLSQSAS